MNCNKRKVTRGRFSAHLRLTSWTVALLATVGYAWAASPVFVPVGDAGNASDVATGFGAVNDAYRIGVNEVTRAEYAAFLNAVAATDTHGLYSPNMGIVRSGNPGGYVYTATEETRSVAWVSWYDALRFANWLHNGQPDGAQGSASTETGAYTFSGETSVSARTPEARVYLPNENEWYKAAYYQGGADAWYWGYPTRSDTPPLAAAPSGSDNAANYDRAVFATTAAGAYPATQGYYGTRDQAGNLWEWNETAVNGDRGLRGGSFDDYPLLLHTSYRDSQDPADENEFVGFRVAAAAVGTPPPPPNVAPVAAEDSYDMNEAESLTVAAPGVLANDADGDGNALTAALVAGPAHGALTLSADGAFTYTPEQTFAGSDSFSYTPNDGVVDGNTVRVTVTVRAASYELRVDSGSGDGSYAFGTVVPIRANAPAPGKVFDRWTGDTAFIADVTAAATTLAMPRSATTVTATYKPVAVAGVDVTFAEWNSKTSYLTVRGVAPASKTVTVTDPKGKRITTVKSRSDGSWSVRNKRSRKLVPKSIRATCNGMTDEMPVMRVEEYDDD